MTQSLTRTAVRISMSLALLLSSRASHAQAPSRSEGTLPNVFATRVQDTLRLILDAARRDSAFPGAIAVVGNRSGIVASYAVGELDWSGGGRPDLHTLWDMASLTKVIALTSSMIRLVQDKRVDLDAPVQRYLPSWTGPHKERVRVRDLLTHSSGLPSWRPLYKETTTADEAIKLVMSTPLEVAPGQRMVYSDLGAILLGEVVKRVSGQSFADFVGQNVLAALGMTESQYNPPASLRPRIAPTEVDPWRQRHIRGEVHDENAARLGGVSAHAGLFSSAADLARFAQAFLNYGAIDGRRVFDSTTVATFTRVQDKALSHRGLGWETANGANSGGRRMSPLAFGHTGFTGTSLWIDPGSDAFVILLTNRVNPTRENRRISDVRISLADAVMPLMKLRGEQR